MSGAQVLSVDEEETILDAYSFLLYQKFLKKKQEFSVITLKRMKGADYGTSYKKIKTYSP